MRALSSRLSILVFVVSLVGCATYPGEAERNFLRGNRFLGEGLPQMAVQSYQRSLGEDPDRPEVWFNLGLAHLRIDQPEQAARAFRRSVKLRPSADAWYNLGYAELRADRPAEAAEALHRSAVLRADRAATWNNLGISNRRLGRYRFAEEAFQKALSIEPTHPEVLNNLAWLYVVWGDAGDERKKRALQLAKRANERTRGRDARILATLAEAYFQNGDQKSAVRAIERALDVDPKNSHFLEKLATYRGHKSPKGSPEPQ